VVCLNHFHTDTDTEIKLAKKLCEQAGARVAVSYHWLKGGEGALDLVDAIIDACNDKVDFKFLYDMNTPLRQRIERIAKEVYGADGVSYSSEAKTKAEKFEQDPKYNDYATMMVKTHLSLSHDPTVKGVPKGWTLHIRDLLTYGGARFICPVAGNISLMPGTGSDPAYRRIDIDVNTGRVKGVF
ncbi:MAG: formate--tetrahydrofolate ligase, partial [Nitrososphaera sp.]